MTKYTSFFIPSHDSGDSLDELNRFLSCHRTVKVSEGFVPDGACPGFHMLVEYVEGESNAVKDNSKQKRKDWRGELGDDPVLTGAFDTLKEFRRGIADRDGVKTYMVAKDEHLYNMVLSLRDGSVLDAEGIRSLPHQKDIMLQKYAEEFSDKLKELSSDTSVEVKDGQGLLPL